jgi:hypothetical protein
MIFIPGYPVVDVRSINFNVLSVAAVMEQFAACVYLFAGVNDLDRDARHIQIVKQAPKYFCWRSKGKKKAKHKHQKNQETRKISQDRQTLSVSKGQSLVVNSLECLEERSIVKQVFHGVNPHLDSRGAAVGERFCFRIVVYPPHG